jgi:hypothetical protein
MVERLEAFREAVRAEWAKKSSHERRQFLASVNLREVCATMRRGAPLEEQAFAVFLYESLECDEDRQAFYCACGKPTWLNGRAL